MASFPFYCGASNLCRSDHNFQQPTQELWARGREPAGATNITIDGNMFVDMAEPFMIDGTTPIASTDLSLNNGVYSGAPATVSNLSIRNNDFIDTRATPVMNFAVIPQLVALITTVIRETPSGGCARRWPKS
ncbi:hypothetical protein ACFUCV_01255 [Specibacter sp. NPDC057265]|uniref:hypothetical protein n=1 Tax=Specibacter sp. NPDC057265 TaxID=3346075 RepID=UPI00363F9AE5